MASHRAIQRAIARVNPTTLATIVLVVAFAGQAVRNLVDWAGFAVVVVLVVAAVVVRLGRAPGDPLLKAAPRALLAFLALCLASLAWSNYPEATALGVAAQLGTALAGALLARSLPVDALLEALWRAMIAIVVLSLAFELVVSVVIGHPVLPLPLMNQAVPPSYYWSNDQLPVLGPLQGIVGNRNLLGFVALLGLVLAAVRPLGSPRNATGERTRSIRASVVWGLVFVLTIALTRSATVLLAVPALIVVGAVAVTVRYVPRRGRRWLYPGGAAGVLALVALAVVHSTTLFSLVGRDDDMSGRAEIWRSVARLAVERPLGGWGWVSYWAPWAEPFQGLVVIDGTPYYQAHNALLDIALQLGIIGVVCALFVAVPLVMNAWRIAASPVDRVGGGRGLEAASLAPLLLVGALLIQSLTESRLLLEGNWLLLVILCVIVRRESPPSGSTRRGPGESARAALRRERSAVGTS